ncbi:MAG: response regulator [Lachnospiraceae bacterium]|jgi:CheY-like chemotaxis protein|nr:response regulator [Lachnospiraceae bacterium]
MRVLNVEDDPMKHDNIKRALNRMGITDITYVECENDAMISVLDSIENNTPYDLIISDMQFPLFSNGKPDDTAGETFIAELQEHNIDIPIIVCSSFRLNIPNILGCVHYNPNDPDLYEEFRKLIVVKK